MSLQRLLDDPDADLNEVTLLRAGKADSMTQETRRKILAGIGVGGALAGLAAVSGQAGKAAWPVWVKTSLLLSALGGIAATVGFFGFGSPAPQASSIRPPAEVTPALVAPAAHPAAAQSTAGDTANHAKGSAAPLYQATELPLAPAVPELPSDNHHDAVAPAGKPGAAATPASDNGGLAAELSALNAAKAQLAAGNAAGALQQVKHYRASFPQGSLATEATVLEVEALTALGQRAQAERAARPLLKADSPYAARLRSLLGQP